MRITPQQLQIQLKDIKLPAKTPGLNLGSILRGTVLNVQSEAIVIQLNDGSNLRAVVENPERFLEGQTLDFKVIESEKEALPKLEIQSKSSDVPAKEMLKNVQMKVTTENIKAIDVLKSLGLNITKDNIETLEKNFKFVSKIAASIQEHGAEVSTQESNEMPLKELATKVINDLSQNLNYETPKNMKEADLKEVVIKLLDLAPKEQVTQEPMPKESVKLESLVKSLLGVVESSNQLDLPDTMDKLGGLMKFEKAFTMNNLSVFDKLMSESENITANAKELIELLDDKVSPKLLSLLKGFDIKNFGNEKAISDYVNEMMTELKEVADKTVSSRVKGSSQELMDKLTFLEKDQEALTWMQLPVQVNDTTKNLDIYMKHDKKEGNQMTKDNAKILIALNTDYLDTVQALIHVKFKKLNIDFRVMHDSVKVLIETHKNLLQSYLSEFDVDIKVENKNKLSLSEFVKEDTQHFINVKV